MGRIQVAIPQGGLTGSLNPIHRDNLHQQGVGKGLLLSNTTRTKRLEGHNPMVHINVLHKPHNNLVQTRLDAYLHLRMTYIKYPDPNRTGNNSSNRLDARHHHKLNKPTSKGLVLMLQTTQLTQTTTLPIPSFRHLSAS